MAKHFVILDVNQDVCAGPYECASRAEADALADGCEVEARPRLLDLFCGAGGAAMGYHRAGFEVVGIDINPQKHYPFEFHQADALGFVATHGREFDAIHASPPCQPYSTASAINGTHVEDLLLPTRAKLTAFSIPYVIENVPGAPIRIEQPGLFSLTNGVLICGSGLGLKIARHDTGEVEYLRRHRLFESNVWLEGIRCRHKIAHRALGVYGGGSRGERHNMALADEAREIMGMPWATLEECCQAIPPAYTEFIGKQLLRAIAARAVA